MLRERNTVLTLFALILAALCLVAGCSGGGDENRQQSAGSDQQGNAAREEQRGGTGNRPALKIALGTIRSVNAEKERFTLKPSAEAQGEEPIPFKLAPEASITLDGRQAELSQMKPGQQAQVEYIVKEEWKIPNRARVVELFSAGG